MQSSFVKDLQKNYNVHKISFDKGTVSSVMMKQRRTDAQPTNGMIYELVGTTHTRSNAGMGMGTGCKFDQCEFVGKTLQSNTEKQWAAL